MTLKDCLKLKGYFPYNFLRTVSKHVDLSLVFYSQYSTLSTVLKEAGLTEKDCDNIMRTLGLTQADYNKIVSKQRKDQIGKQSSYEIKLLTIAYRLHEDFFELYPGLKRRCEREHEFLRKNGYVRTWHGPIRHLPEVLYMNIDRKSGSLKGVDRLLYSKQYSGMKNQAGNTTIQTLEVYHASQLVNSIDHNIERNGMKSRVWNYVHDSFDVFCHKSEFNALVSLVRKSIEVPRYPEFGIRCELDGVVSDVSGKNRKSEYYKSGRDVKIEDSLDEYNRKNGTSIEFENVIRT